MSFWRSGSQENETLSHWRVASGLMDDSGQNLTATPGTFSP